MYETTTREITVRVRPHYLDEKSEPDEGYFFWVYTVEIENTGSDAVQLKARHWIITDGHGATQEVRGDGVVGEKPVIPAGESYSYTSGCPLNTPSGIMVGSYLMEDEDGEPFDVAIPAFSLDCPYAQRSVN